MQTSSLILVQELKEHHDKVSSHMQTGTLETMKTLNLGTQNQENIDPNMGSNLFDHPQSQWSA